MPRVISVHEYDLKEGIRPDEFIKRTRQAHAEGLFNLPGLESFHFLRVIKGEARSAWSAIWIYASDAAWERLWGSPEDPKPRSEYPERWRRWEDDYLAPLLESHPDMIRFASYTEVWASHTTATE